MLIPCWDGGRDAALDVTVVHPLQQALVTEAAQTPGHAVQEAHNRKWRASGADCQEQGISFLPMAVESSGGWHEGAVAQIKKLASAAARQTGQEEKEAAFHAFTRLSILLQRGNAAILANRLAPTTTAAVDGVLDGDG